MRAWMDVEGVFEGPCFPGDANVDPRPDAAVDDGSVRRHARLPAGRVVSKQVVDDAASAVGGREPDARFCAEEAKADRRASVASHERQVCTLPGERE
jgi:hypothetical protein